MIDNYREIIEQNNYCFSNYKEMCIALSEPCKSGASKRSQLKNWARYFSMLKPKYINRIEIQEIYDNPLPKVRKKKEKNIHIKGNEYTFTENVCIGYTNKGEEFYFDSEDYEIVKNHTWHKDKYGYINTNMFVDDKWTLVKMHRLLTCCPNDVVVDHINHCRHDNRKKNLRICTQHENSFNRSLHVNNSIGLIGVSKRFYVSITKDGRAFHSSCPTRESASNTRDELAKELFGEYANLNNYSDKDAWFALPKETLIKILEGFNNVQSIIEYIRNGGLEKYIE